MRASNAFVSPGDVPLRHLAVVGADDDDVLVDERHAAPVDAHVDEAAGSERRVELAAGGLERDQTSSDRHQDARRDRAVAGPVREPAARRCAAGACGRRQHCASTTAAPGCTACARPRRRPPPSRLQLPRAARPATPPAAGGGAGSPSCGAARHLEPHRVRRVRHRASPRPACAAGAAPYRQITDPVSASSATTPLGVDAYITPLMTIGVCCVPTPWNVHAVREPRHVGRVDLRQLRVLRPGEVAGKARPVGVGERLDAVLSVR